MAVYANVSNTTHDFLDAGLCSAKADKIFCCQFFLLNSPTLSQPQCKMISVDSRDDLKVGINANRPGTYFLAIQNLTKTIGQGDELMFQTLFTGEGQIDHPRILLKPSEIVFEAERSIIRNNLSIVDDDSFATAASSNNFDPKGCSILLQRGDEHDEWELSTYFFDLNPQAKAAEIAGSFPNPAATVRKLTSSPFSFALKSKKRTRPGKYTLDIQFTYFNGREWKSDSKVIQFRVLNFLGKYIGYIRLLCRQWFAPSR